jgi:uncharacterized protein YndB with AHSA1/START domain
MTETTNQPKTEFTTPGDMQVMLTRELKATPERVFSAFVDPAKISQWWGPREYTTEIDVHEPHAGGRWRYFNHTPDGTTHAFHGVLHEVTEPTRIVRTFEYEGAPGFVNLETLMLKDLGDGTTLVTMSVACESPQQRDAMVNSGMERGAVDSIERLAELVE